MMGFSAIEPFGGSTAAIAGLMNLLANILGVVWLLWLAVMLIRKK